MSLISNLQVEGNGLDLFTMQSAKYAQITTKFTLKVMSVDAGPGVTPVSKSSFRLKTGLHQATLSLSESISGPQDIELVRYLVEVQGLSPAYAASRLVSLGTALTSRISTLQQNEWV